MMIDEWFTGSIVTVDKQIYVFLNPTKYFHYQLLVYIKLVVFLISIWTDLEQETIDGITRLTLLYWVNFNAYFTILLLMGKYNFGEIVQQTRYLAFDRRTPLPM